MHFSDRSDSFDLIDVNEMTTTPMASRAQLPALEPFAAASHTLRVQLAEKDPKFPSLDLTGPPPVWDNNHAIFIGLVPFKGGLAPCKIVPDFMPDPVRFGYNGVECTISKDEPFFIVPLDPKTMEWVQARDGKAPEGRKPVHAGFEENGEPLWHAVALIDGVRVPGKAGEHLNGALVPYGGGEQWRAHYQVLCWRH